MAFKLERQKTDTTPYVLMDDELGYIKIEGKCYLENIVNFFVEINDWLKKYLTSGFTTLTIDCELTYFSSATTKQLYNMLKLIEKHITAQQKIVVNWIYTPDNELVFERGEDLKDGIKNIVFNMTVKTQV